MPSPDVAEALCLNVLVLLPSWMLQPWSKEQPVLLTSAPMNGPPSLMFWPTNIAASLLASVLPVVTSELPVVLRASTDAAPADTTPSTCPATPSPVVEVAVCEPVRRLLPFCRLHPWSRLQPSPLRSVTIGPPSSELRL